MGGKPDLVRWALSGYARGSGDTYGPKSYLQELRMTRHADGGVDGQHGGVRGAAVRRPFVQAPILTSPRRRGRKPAPPYAPFAGLAAFSAPAAGV